MSLEAELVFFQWCTGILLFAGICWAVVFGILAFRERPGYRRGQS